jgi:hypothetical protein
MGSARRRWDEDVVRSWPVPRSCGIEVVEVAEVEDTVLDLGERIHGLVLAGVQIQLVESFTKC